MLTPKQAKEIFDVDRCLDRIEDILNYDNMYFAQEVCPVFINYGRRDLICPHSCVECSKLDLSRRRYYYKEGFGVVCNITCPCNFYSSHALAMEKLQEFKNLLIEASKCK